MTAFSQLAQEQYYNSAVIGDQQNGKRSQVDQLPNIHASSSRKTDQASHRQTVQVSSFKKKVNNDFFNTRRKMKYSKFFESENETAHSSQLNAMRGPAESSEVEQMAKRSVTHKKNYQKLR